MTMLKFNYKKPIEKLLQQKFSIAGIKLKNPTSIRSKTLFVDRQKISTEQLRLYLLRNVCNYIFVIGSVYHRRQKEYPKTNDCYLPLKIVIFRAGYQIVI